MLLLLLLPATVARATPEVTLITVGPGDEVWENFGHDMLRVRDHESGFDACYNWGLFDFDQPGFIRNFVQGRPEYWMAAFDTEKTLELYKRQNRRVIFQTLKLTERQTIDLIRRCEINRLEANKFYRYDYFRDNCTTRVRDMIDTVTAGEMSRAMKGVPVGRPVTYRSESVRLMQGDFWVSLGTDFALGPACDVPLDRWAEGFLPEQVAESAVAVAGPTTEQWHSTRPPAPAAAPRRWPWLFLAGLSIGAATVALSAWRWWAGRVVAFAWWGISGLGGLFMVLIWAFTDHWAAHANQNLWHYSPLALTVPLLLTFRQRRAALGVAVLIVALSVLGAMLKGFGLLSQHNLGFILLAIPANLAAARSLTTSTPPDEVADHAQNPGGPVPGVSDGDHAEPVRLHQS